MKKRIVALVLAVLTLVLALGFAGCKKNDKTDWDYIADKGELVIGITYFRPMNYMENGRAQESDQLLQRLHEQLPGRRYPQG